ncbi:MAG: GNAT family N-acetyltransferase [Eubacteriales bacterium]|nr:GNAT family N-acetyltransferase [Eubacteriales bacterium]
MDYIIKNVTNENELDKVLAFTEDIFGDRTGWESAGYSREKWLERMDSQGDLMLFAEYGGEVIGIVFGRIENGEGITIGPVAVDERFRKYGIAREMMLKLEKRALGHGIHRLCLGATESAEGFYEKLGYTGQLLIQSEKHTIKELIALNPGYLVVYTNIYDEKINQLFLKLDKPDRELQRLYEKTFDECWTQTMFWKVI